MNPKSPHPHPDDVAIGGRIRAARTRAGVSQERLGEACDVTSQQVQKYEKGTNRVSGSRLIRIAQALRVSVADLTGEGAGSAVLSDMATFSRTAQRAAEIVDCMPAPLATEVVRMLARLAALAGTTTGATGTPDVAAAAE